MKAHAVALTIFITLVGTLPCAAQPPASFRQVVNLDTRPGVTVRYVAMTPFLGGGMPAALVLLAGGNGRLAISNAGGIGTSLSQNFLIRSREFFLQSGAAVVVAVDAPSDRPNGMNGIFRLSPEHAQDLAAVMQDVRTRYGFPVWLVGTSTGTMSVANSGSFAGPVRPTGVVFTSTQTRRTKACGRTVFDDTLAAIPMPALVVSHSEDACACSPAPDADAILSALTASWKKDKKIFSGGLAPASGPCDARAPHGYYGIERSVTDFIMRWIGSAFLPIVFPFPPLFQR
jgi:hypothetical protein